MAADDRPGATRAEHHGLLHGIVGAYAVGAAAFALWAWRGGAAVARWAMARAVRRSRSCWPAVTLIAGVDANESWTSDVLVNGFFVMPGARRHPAAPDRLRRRGHPDDRRLPGRPAWSTQSANEEPSVSIVLRTLVLAGLGAGCVAPVRRSSAHGWRRSPRLLEDRTGAARRPRAGRGSPAPRALRTPARRSAAVRAGVPGSTSTTCATAPIRRRRGRPHRAGPRRSPHGLLRSTVTELHPAVLEQAGLAARPAPTSPPAEGRGGLVDRGRCRRLARRDAHAGRPVAVRRRSRAARATSSSTPAPAAHASPSGSTTGGRASRSCDDGRGIGAARPAAQHRPGPHRPARPDAAARSGRRHADRHGQPVGHDRRRRGADLMGRSGRSVS